MRVTVWGRVDYPGELNGHRWVSPEGNWVVSGTQHVGASSVLQLLQRPHGRSTTSQLRAEKIEPGGKAVGKCTLSSLSG